MIEGLIIILFLSFIGLIIALVGQRGAMGLVVVIIESLVVLITAYLLIRVRVKISHAEKEKLKAKISELEDKINSISARQ